MDINIDKLLLTDSKGRGRIFLLAKNCPAKLSSALARDRQQCEIVDIRNSILSGLIVVNLIGTGLWSDCLYYNGNNYIPSFRSFVNFFSRATLKRYHGS